MSLAAKLGAAKERAALQMFEVRITETLQKTVVVEARDRNEAKDIVSEKWRHSNYILDSGDLADVKFDTLYGTPDRSLDSIR